MEEHYSTHMKCSKNTDKLINCEGAAISGINTIAYLSRLELFVSEKQWFASSIFQKGALACLINILEERISIVLLEWNNQRSNPSLDS